MELDQVVQVVQVELAELQEPALLVVAVHQGLAVQATYTLSIPNANTVTLFVTLASFCANNSNRYTSIFDSATGNTVSSTNSSIVTTTTYDGCVLFQVQGCGNNNPPTANNQTLLYKVDRGSYSDDTQYCLQATAGTINFTWNFNSSGWESSLGVWRVGTRKRLFNIT
jgi:hypothetical protein